MQFMQRSQDWSRRWVDRAEVKRDARAKRSTSRREVRSWEGLRFGLTAQPRGVPAADAFPATNVVGTVGLLIDLPIEGFFWWRHRFQFHKTWRVTVTILDQGGFDTSDSLRLVVASRASAVTALSEVSDILREEGLQGLEARIASGELQAEGKRAAPLK